MHRRVLLYILLLHSAYSSCPKGLDIACNGECRGYYGTVTSKFIEETAVEKCKELGANPVIIHNLEQQTYWMARVSTYGYIFALGLACNKNTKKWEWVDGSAIDYKPSNYNSQLDQSCVSMSNTTSWILKNFKGNEWETWDSLSSARTDIYCTMQLQPASAASNCMSLDENDDGICYEVQSAVGTWQDSQKLCQNLGGKTASIHNLQVNSFIRRLAVSQGAVNGLYIGAIANGTDKQYEWVDGSNWDYQQFHPGFPMSGNGDCLAMDTISNSGDWMNMNCNTKLAVACRRDKDFSIENVCSSGPWEEGQFIYSPGFPYNASVPCEYLLSVTPGKKVRVEVLLLEANSCCDYMVLVNDIMGTDNIANLTGQIVGESYEAKTNFMRVKWQPNGGNNVRGMVFKFSGV